MSIEQMVRDLLEQALRDGLVRDTVLYADPDPQCRSSGELCGAANLLAKFLRNSAKKRDDRWQRAVGHSLETAEELAAIECGQ